MASAVARSAARGAIAAMAMSGMRRVSTTIGMLQRTPPEAILAERAPGVFYRMPVERRPALVEAVHIMYGTLGGMVFGALPQRWRRRAWLGPAYGLLFWTGYELAIRPVLGLTDAGKGWPLHRLALVADHLLYGVVVGASPWPYRN
jgi:hypothetical protein